MFWLTDHCHKERVINCQQAPWPENDLMEKVIDTHSSILAWRIPWTEEPGGKISCMKRVASPGSMHDTGCLGLVHWDGPEGWNGEGRGRRVQQTGSK